MNKIYYAVVSEDWGGTYVSAPNLKIAKKIAMRDEIISECIGSYIDLKCHARRDSNRKIIHTELPVKVLSIGEIITEKCHWWFCKNADCEQDERFEHLDTGEWGQYKCPKCGMVFDIPYTNC